MAVCRTTFVIWFAVSASTADVRCIIPDCHVCIGDAVTLLLLKMVYFIFLLSPCMGSGAVIVARNCKSHTKTLRCRLFCWLRQFFCFSFVFLVYVALCLIVFGCQCQCNWLPGKTRLRNDLLCVEWDVKPYTLTHSLLENPGKTLIYFSKISRTCRVLENDIVPGNWSVGSCKVLEFLIGSPNCNRHA